MRALLLLAPLLAGCQLLLGIDDPTGDRCSPFDVTTCELDETCDIFFTDTAAYLDCRSEGATPVGQICNSADDCAGGLICFGGVCHAFCEVPGVGCASPDGVCLIDFYGYRICDSECNVFDGTGCEAGLDCMVDTTAPVFTAQCTRRDFHDAQVGVDADCSSGEFCGVGLACVPEDFVCAYLCTPGGDPCTDPDRICDSIDDLHGNAMGFCLPP